MSNRKIIKHSTRSQCVDHYDNCDKPDGYPCKELCEHHAEYMPELKPCPFCGSDAELMWVGKACWARCSKHECMARIAYYDTNKERMICVWNTRPESSPAQDGWIKERLERYLEETKGMKSFGSGDVPPMGKTVILYDLIFGKVEGFRGKDNWCVPSNLLAMQITHWQPLPTPPKSNAQQAFEARGVPISDR